MTSNYRKIGDFIRQSKAKNNDGLYSELLGININKFFMPSVANVVGVNLKSYKIVKKGQFACNRMHVGRDYRIPVALSNKNHTFLVSPAYDVFEIIDENELLPEYLMMWFRRREYDRNAWFHTDGDVRGGLSWSLFCDLNILVPNITEQKKIVQQYKAVSNRIKLNKKINKKLEEAAQTLYKHWFVDFEFPNHEGKPYSSSSGEMIHNEELDKDIPFGWEVKDLSEVTDISAGGDKPKVYSSYKTAICTIPIFSNGVTHKGLYGYTNKSKYHEYSITVSARGTIGYSVLRDEPFDAIVRLLVLTPKKEGYSIYLWHTLNLIEFADSGSVQSQLTKPQISLIKISIPSQNIVLKYQSILERVYQKIKTRNSESEALSQFISILLAKMSKVEERIYQI